MAKKTGDNADAGAVASPPCMLHELDPHGRPRVAGRVEDVPRWRKAERERLLAARLALTPEYRAAQTLLIVRGIEQLAVIAPGAVVSVYWPMRAEPDLRPWMAVLCEHGQRVLLPVVVARGQPLVFREWRPGTRLARGIWNIPYPADGAVLTPDVAIAPVVGFDGQCYRLGYGGGYFDRTLASLDPRPLAIGIGYPSAALATIHPQPHDMPMDWIVTGTTTPISRGTRTTRP
jgi:5-formyltetrahydrofolate cyclo-ligase